MKTVLFVISMLSISSAFAANSQDSKTQQVTCSFRSNGDLQMTVTFQNENVQGVSLYNVDWSQSAEATYSKVTSIMKSDLGEEVTLASGQRVAVPFAAMRGYSADAVVNGTDEYSCN